MVAVDLKSLVAKMNDLCRRSLEAAAGLTLSRSNFNVEIEHWLLKLLEASDSDLVAVLRNYDVEPARLSADLTRVLDRLKTGNTRAPALSPHVVSLMREAWTLASLDSLMTTSLRQSSATLPTFHHVMLANRSPPSC